MISSMIVDDRILYWLKLPYFGLK